MFVDGAIEEGTGFTVFAAQAVDSTYIYEPPATPSSTFNNTAASLAVAGTGTFAVPEPTSGLLLLLGMAGLALRRKNA